MLNVMQLLWIVFLAMPFMHISLAIKSKKFVEDYQNSVDGLLIPDASGTRLLSCTSKCLHTENCTGILYGKEIQGVDNRCMKIIQSTNCSDRINLHSWPDHKYFAMKRGCTDLGIGVTTPKAWESNCPILYFSLDTANPGTAQGLHAGNIEFTSGGKVGNVFKNPVPDSLTQSWYQLGTYPNSSFCFPDPESCPDGMSIAFWMKIISQGSGIQGFIATATMDAPGFNVWWYDTGSDEEYKGISIAVKRGSDATSDLIFVNKTTFLGGNPYGTWFHFVMTYK